MKNYKGIFVVSFLLIFGKSFAQVSEEKTSFTIEEAREYAIQNNEKVLNSILDYEKAKKKVWETTAIGLPQIDLSGSFQHFIDIPTTVVDASFLNPQAPPGSTAEFKMGTKFNTKAELQVSQILFNGSYLVGLKAAKNYKEFVSYSVNKSAEEIKYQVSKAYYSVLVAKENVRLLDSIINTTENIYNDTKAIFDEGLIEEIEVDQIELSLAQLKSSRTRAKRSVDISENLLKFQMGVPIEKEIELTESLNDFTNESSILETQNAAFTLEENSDYIILSKQMELDQLNVKNERADSYPSLVAFFTHNQQAMRNEFNFFDSNENWFPTTLWGLTLNIPITSSGQRIFQTQQAKLQVKQDENNIKQLERSLALQESQSRINFQNAYDIVKTEEKNLAIAQKIYNNAQIRKDNGFSGALQLSQAQNQLIQAQQSYIMAVYDLLDARVELKKITNQYKENITLENK